MNRTFFIAIFIGIFLKACLFSQVKTYKFNFINQDVDLRSEKINSFVQDDNGFIWIATLNGLYRYDGIHCKYYNLQPANQPFQLGVEITCLTKSQDGTFVIGTKNCGIYIFDPKTEASTFCSTNKNDSFLFSTTVNSCLISNNIVYIGTDQGLYRSGKDCQNFQRCKNIPDTKIFSIYQSVDQTIWLGTNDFGLIELPYCQATPITHLPGINRNSVNSITSIAETSPNTFYLGTWNNGLLKFDRNSGQFQKIKNNPRFDYCVVRDVIYDHAGNLWLATYAEGLYKYSLKSNTFTSFKSNGEEGNNLSNNTIISVFLDKSDVLWVGTWGGYACTLDPNSAPILSFSKELKRLSVNIPNDISSIAETPDGNLWITSYTDGATKILVDYKGIVKYNMPKLSNAAINSICTTSEGSIWLGTCNGFNKISAKNGTISLFNLPNSTNNSPSNSISCIKPNDQGFLWIGSDDGKVNKFDCKKESFETVNGIANPGYISDFFIDKNGTVWIAGHNGLFKLDYEKHQIINCDYYQKNNIPFAIRRILPSENGNLLLSTESSGLIQYSPSKNEFLTLINYSKIGSIQDMKYDSRYTLWLAGSCGLFSYQPKSKRLIDHSYQQGVPKVPFSSLCFTQNGLLIIGGKNMAYFNPYFQQHTQVHHPVVFTDLLVMDKKIEAVDTVNGKVLLTQSIANTHKIRLSYADNIFTLNFAALDYSNPQLIEYRYKLEGFDKDWHYTNAQKAFATYTNLNEGRYKLIVEATNSYKQWVSKPAIIEITIVPPFWKTIWFKASLMLIVTLVIFSFYKYKLTVKNNELEHIKNERLTNELLNKEEILSAKNSELTSSVVHISSKNEILHEIRRELRSIKYSDNTNDIKKSANRISSIINQNFATDNHWEKFETHFNQLNQNFFDKLKLEFPELTNTNLKLCAYVRLKLGSKEISSLMNISPNAVLKSKYRLKQKLNLDKENDLYDFLIKY